MAWESLIEIRETEVSEDVVADVPQPERRWPRWFWPAIAAFSFALIALGVIIYVTTDYGRVKIIVDGPKADVQVDGEQILVKTPRESITLRAGTHELAVKWRDGEYKTRAFVVHRGDNEELRVEYEPKHSPDKPPVPPAVDSSSPPKTITNSLGMRLKLIPAGEFDMGLSDEQVELILKQDLTKRCKTTESF